jgi:NADPH-dependent glutamate synthase beta subunit-like oxidoreductase/NAD(P)H-flavin reductase
MNTHSKSSDDSSGSLRAGPFRLGLPGFAFTDLFEPLALARLKERFVADLEHRDPSLGLEYLELLQRGNPTRADETRMAMLLGPHLGRFLGSFFCIEGCLGIIEEETHALELLFAMRRDFVRRRVQKKMKSLERCGRSIAELNRLVGERMGALGSLHSGEHPEMQFCRALKRLLDAEAGESAADLSVLGWAKRQGQTLKECVATELALFEQFTAAHLDQHPRHPFTATWVVFTLQHAMNWDDLVPRKFHDPQTPEKFRGPETSLRRRDGFHLTDPRMELRHVMGQVDTCIYCHEQDRDTCSKGHHDRKTGDVQKNPLGIPLEGCPLDEHISEAHLLRSKGEVIGALAAIMINNPMCPGTGHRICNDCMKSCIYQKQDPVNIPEIETSILTQVLALPYGIEIYGLLTRWNPLNLRRPHQLPLNGKKVLVVGLGPAGYTLSHYLTQEGFGVVAVDGLKLEPLPRDLVGPHAVPVPSWEDFIEPLDRRSNDGFGGVSEYGITVRWDKNFLRLLYLTLSRKRGLKFYGGVRFGGTITLEDARELGFDHVAIATGAGKPTVVPMKNNLIRGVRKASDFLMALQLSGACRKDSLANLEVRLPAVVIGGGLTAIDTATELLAYYPVMVEKILDRCDLLKESGAIEGFLSRLAPDERVRFEEFATHGAAIRAERVRAEALGEVPNFLPLLRQFGGVTLAYRKSLSDSPAYRLNHEEVIKALEEGIDFLEGVSPQEAVADEGDSIKALILSREDGSTLEVPCRALMVAAGTSPNVIYEKEYPGTFAMDGKFFKPHTANTEGGVVELTPAKDATEAFFTSYKDGITVSFYGDNHPAYAGNVVKAMASARHGYPKVCELFKDAIHHLDSGLQDVRNRSYEELIERLNESLVARVERVVRLTSTITEVVLKAPLQARRFEPGQFYRFQDFERDAPVVRGVRLSMEGLALTGAWVDKEAGLLSLIILEMGGSSNLCAMLKPGQEVVCMGPTGTPTEIPSNEKVILLGGGLGNAVLFSIAKALKAAGSSVLYFAGYKDGKDFFKREEIEASTDQVIYSTDVGEVIEAQRGQDAHFRGNIVQAMLAYERGELGAKLFPLKEATRIIAIGSDRMMAAVAAARHNPELLKPCLGPHEAVGSINSPMQCMMKEVCAQCLQKHRDPATGKEWFVFSCFNQDQNMDHVDFHHLNLRLRQNGVLEKLAASTIALLMKEGQLSSV